jgi:RNA polymerase sigma-70 factor (ECF subfamily)
VDRERAVVDRLKAGDASALGFLYEWFGDRLYRKVILPRLHVVEQAEDVLKDTFRLTLERIHQYEVRDRSIYFWMRRIAINRALDVHRANSRRNRLHEAVKNEPGSLSGNPGHAPDRVSDRAETRALIEEALAEINPRYALALRLRLLEDRDRAECAGILGVTVGNFDVILHRAAKAFRKKYPPR